MKKKPVPRKQKPADRSSYERRTMAARVSRQQAARHSTVRVLFIIGRHRTGPLRKTAPRRTGLHWYERRLRDRCLENLQRDGSDGARVIGARRGAADLGLQPEAIPRDHARL